MKTLYIYNDIFFKLWKYNTKINNNIDEPMISLDSTLDVLPNYHKNITLNLNFVDANWLTKDEK